ncbi:MAG: polysaccharide ABC transporter ATP-binding protein [Crocinitomicaceae bacterium]|nr:polysaccharide ABC transporter ATP-binding protein [Crocinitomicaceae bacterium]
MKENTSIRVSDLGKRYSIGKQKDTSLRSTLTGIFKPSSKVDQFWALKNINFEINKGDVVGIIGKNGAGKSTLLKVLSQITKPTTGKIEINGRVASLLEVGTGFHPELTGRENVYLNGTILGMTRQEVKDKFDQIVAFSGVGKFIDTPVKNYSSGMYVRLAFSVAAHLEPEILIIDEVLAVGDAEFQRKCLGKMGDAAREGITILFVSHNIAAVKELCTKGIVLKSGEIQYSGSQLEAIDFYHKINTPPKKTNGLFTNELIEIKSFETKSNTLTAISISSGFTFSMDFLHKTENKNLALTFELRSKDEVIVFHHGTWLCEENDSKKGIYSISGDVPANFLNAGHYSFNVIFASSLHDVFMNAEGVHTIEVENETLAGNNTILPGVTRPMINYSTEFKEQ